MANIFNFVKSKLTIQEVVSDYVQIKPAGTYLKGSCPFHSETDASFTVSPDKNIFYCFGCHTGGDVISFIAKAENLSQKEAVEFMIDKYKLDVPEEIRRQSPLEMRADLDKKEKFFQTCTSAAKWMHTKLLTTQHALSYLTKRSIPHRSIKYFEIGYLPSGVRNINMFIKDMAAQNILLTDLIDANILMEGRSTVYSPYEERIIFPIKDTMGRYCGFGGRIFQTEDQRAKYYNSKESDFFLKGKLLFGFDLAKKEMAPLEYAFLVEGYTDSVAMHEHGYKNTVATLGTACTAEHLKILSRHINKLYVMYDGDAAGQKAILRLTELCWNVNLELYIVKLPPKEDPASYLNTHKTLEKLIENASDIFTFFVESVGGNFWQKSLSEKMNASEKIIATIAQVNNRIRQDLLLQKAANITQIPFESLQQILQKQKTPQESSYGRQEQTQSIPQQPITKYDSISLIEAKIFAVLISKPHLEFDKKLLQYFSDPAQNLINKLYKSALPSENNEFDFHAFIETLETEEQNWVVQKSIIFNDKVTQEVLNQLFFHFQKQNWKQIVQAIKIKIVQARQAHDIEKLQELLSIFSKMTQGMKNKGLI